MYVVMTTNVIDRETDRQTTCDRKTIVHRAVKITQLGKTSPPGTSYATSRTN